MKSKVPILYVIFNRPDTATNSFHQIRQYKPDKLYIAADGPRDNNKKDIELCRQTRKQILDLIDWPCNVKTLFRDKNIGCGIGVSEGISWMFKYENYGIIIEDDCIVSESFFLFSEEILEKYNYDQRIGMISGFNPIAEQIKTDSSYYFSKYKSCWGWATWKRAWDNMDYLMEWRRDEYLSVISNMGYNAKDIKYWSFRIEAMESGYVKAWDWRWYFTLAAQNQLTIFPQSNMVTNIGIGNQATHTRNGFFRKKVSMPQIDHLTFPLQHPKIFSANVNFDRKFYYENLSILERIKIHLPITILHRIKKIF